jgi:hypothetical protein
MSTKSGSTFKVRIRRDPDDPRYWLVNMVGEPGAQSFGRSLNEARRHAVEVVALWTGLEPEEFTIDWDVHLGALSRSVTEARTAMEHAERDRCRRDLAVRRLTDAGISYRDVGELLGLSYQRVAQIARAS